MAIFGNKRRKEGADKNASPPQKDLPNGRFDPAHVTTAAQEFTRHPGNSSNHGPPPSSHLPPTRSNLVPAQNFVTSVYVSQNPPNASSNPSHPSAISQSQSQSQSTSQPQPQSQSQPQLQPQAQPHPGNKPPGSSNSTVIYPWSHRRLGLLPPAPFPGDPSSHQGSASLRPSTPPFPRYGHSVNAMGTPNGSGDLYIFAGLVKDQVKNDLYVLNVAPTPNPSASSSPALSGTQLHNQILTVGQVETRGEVPLPRVGHASVGVGNVLIVWGGDTKTSEEEIQDDGLYLLNLSTREWTRVKIAGPCPEGRYGHSAAIVGSKFYIFGGQTDHGGFMNDLWSFDLHKLKTGAPEWNCVEPAADAPVPSRRTGHTVVTHAECIFVFGGTDGQYHYNDTWRFDTTTGQWKELDCIGYIPLPREGQSATLVDDVMYVLGGRGVDGKDLDDLAAFKISNQRWYMFQNMGPAPAGRSGHSMASWQGKVYVLGGESYTSTRPDDPSIVHVLDTGKIKYPPDPTTVARQQMQVIDKKTSASNLNSPLGNLSGPQGNAPSSIPLATRHYASPTPPDNTPNSSEAAANRNIKRATTGVTQAPPSRPRREDDPPIHGPPGSALNRRTIGSASTPPSRTMSPSQSTIASQQGPVSANIHERMSRRSMSPVISHSKNTSLDQAIRSSPTSATGNKPVRPSPPNNLHSVVHSNQPGSHPSSPVNRRVSSEVVRMLSNASPPVGRSTPTTNVHKMQTLSNAPPSEDFQKLQKRNMWMKAALATAIKQGFVPSDLEASDDVADRAWLASFQPSNSTSDKGKDWQRLVEALVQLKRELAKAKTQMITQAKSLDDRVSGATKTRTAALQEASFYRVKLAAYEAGSISDINKIERERIADLEQKLSEIITSKSGLERQVLQLTHELDHERQLREMLQDNTSKSNERANHLEALHSRTALDYEELLNKTRGLDHHASESVERCTVLESSTQSLLIDLEGCREKLKDSESANQKYLVVLEQLQHTLKVTHSKVEEMQELWDQSRNDLEMQKSVASELTRELEARVGEISAAHTKVEELEQILRTTKQENDALRSLNETGLADLVALSRSNSQRVLESHHDGGDGRRRMAEEETSGFKVLHEHSKTKLETALMELTEVKTRNMVLDRELIVSKSEIGAMRLKCSQLMNESNKIKYQISVKEWDLKEKARMTEAAEVKASLMKNLMAENGFLAADDEMLGRSYESGPSGTSVNPAELGPEQLVKRVKELEHRLEQRTHIHRQLETQHEDAQKEMQAAEEKYRDAHRKHEAAADEIASLVQEVQRLRSGGASSVSPASAEGHGKAEEELQVLQERHRTLEQTHIKAVQYVKGTEKMLRRMKDELSKYKDKTESLEVELGEARRCSQTTNANDPHMTNELRAQLTELTTQLEQLRMSSKQSTTDNEELQRRMGSLQAEYEKDMSSYEASATQKMRAVREELGGAQSKNEKLQAELAACIKQNQSLSAKLNQAPGKRSDDDSDGSSKELLAQLAHAQKQVDWLKRENADLQSRCRDAEAKISLLLDHMENHSGTSSPTHDGNAQGNDHESNGRFPWDDEDHRGRSSGRESMESDYCGYGGVATGGGNTPVVENMSQNGSATRA